MRMKRTRDLLARTLTFTVLILFTGTNCLPNCEPSGSSSPESQQPFYVVTLGDSIMWGQGLPDGSKFRDLVTVWVQAQFGAARQVIQIPTRAHSGAIIAVGPSDADQATGLAGEIPNSYPTISKQVELTLTDLQHLAYHISGGDVNLVLIDGGINNVGVLEILKPTHSSGTIEAFTNAAMDKMAVLLQQVRSAFPHAGIVVAGYYPIVSSESKLPELVALFSAFGGALGSEVGQAGGGILGGVAGAGTAAAGKPQMVANSAAFANTAQKRLKEMIAQLNSGADLPPVALAWPNFQGTNDYGAQDTFLWRVTDFVGTEAEGAAGSNPQPPTTPNGVAWNRAHACPPDPKCIDASMGHPNLGGAKAYAGAIEDAIRNTTLWAYIGLPATAEQRPTITAVTPNSTPAGSDATVTITGKNFICVRSVDWADKFTVNSPTQITAHIPNNPSSGPYGIQVRTCADYTNAVSFSVFPVVTSVSPTSGPAAGGTEVTLNGIGFNATTAVLFGNARAQTRQGKPCESSTRCVAVSPTAPKVGTVNVDLVGVPSATTVQFTYLPPTITGIYPSRGPITGGTRVQIAGSSFPAYGGPDIQLSIGDVKSAAGCGYGSCFFETPPAPRSGKVHIIATAFGGSSTPSPTDLFEYTDYPELTEFHVPDLSSADRSEASISLNGNAPAGGAAIALTSDKPGVVGVPQIVTILGSSVAVPLTLLPTPKDETVSLTATYQGTSATATLNVAAWPPISLFLNPLDNAHADVTITISTFAQTGGAAISLQTSDPSALSLPVPPRVTIPAGSYKATFPIISHPSAHIVGGNVVFNPKSVTISASYPGGTASLSTSVPFRLLCQQRKCASGFYWNQKDCRCDPGPPQ